MEYPRLIGYYYSTTQTEYNLTQTWRFKKRKLFLLVDNVDIDRTVDGEHRQSLLKEIANKELQKKFDITLKKKMLLVNAIGQKYDLPFDLTHMIRNHILNHS